MSAPRDVELAYDEGYAAGRAAVYEAVAELVTQMLCDCDDRVPRRPCGVRDVLQLRERLMESASLTAELAKDATKKRTRRTAA